MSTVFDPSTGARLYRRASARIFARLRARVAPAFPWLAEIGGVAILAVGVGLINPPLGIAIGGAYLILIGNSGDES
jgi:hypothetical protein